MDTPLLAASHEGDIMSNLDLGLLLGGVTIGLIVVIGCLLAVIVWLTTP